MRISGLVVTNYGLYVVVATVLASLQCSLWLQFFGYFPSPQIWLTTLTYWSVYRKPSEGIVMVYLLTALASSLSNIPLNILLPINVAIFLILIGIKQRIFWVGATYFTALSFLATIMFPTFHITLSYFFERNWISDPEFLDWILSGLITSLLCLPLYQLYQKLDKLTQMELPSEAGSSNYE